MNTSTKDDVITIADTIITELNAYFKEIDYYCEKANYYLDKNKVFIETPIQKSEKLIEKSNIKKPKRRSCYKKSGLSITVLLFYISSYSIFLTTAFMCR